VNEFDLINNIKSKYTLNSIGDDCAVLPKDGETDQLMTADMLVEDVDFRLEWTRPELLGHKALAVSLSDIAAMGGDPRWAMISIAVPSNLWDTGFIDLFYEGYMALAREFSVDLIGGDLSRSPDKLVIDSVVSGSVPKGKAILRSGAKPGDGIFVTGTLGGAAGGLQLLEGSSDHAVNSSELIQKQLKPRPQVETAKLLQVLGVATAMIDISDGLSSDLWHICEMSAVGAELDAESIPIDPLLREHFPAAECLELALNGGEDFQLLFTADEKKFRSTDLAGITQIGRIAEGVGKIELITDGITTPLRRKGYRHF
jgi:thiamine-monophosphate kinase